MGTPHKHAEVIKAWADGEEIEYKAFAGGWQPVTNPCPSFYGDFAYRIKPKIVKKEAWVALYAGQVTFQTKEECVDRCPQAMAHAHIEWEEEQ